MLKALRTFMSNSRIFDYKIWLTLVLSAVFGFIFLALLPMLSEKPLLLLALPFAGLFFILLVVKPKWVLALIVFFRPLLDNLLNSTRTDSEGVGLGAILNLLVIILVIFLVFHYHSFPSRNPVAKSWLLYLFFMFLAAAYSPYLSRGGRLFLNFVSYFAMFLMPFLVIKTKEDFLFWLKLLCASFVLPVFFADLDLLHGGRYYADAGMRVAGTFSHPNILAFYLVLGITLYFYMIKSNFVKSKFMWMMQVLLVNMLILLVFTKTRNAWLACASIFLIYGLLKDKKFLIVFSLLLPLTLLVPQVQDRVLTVMKGKESNNYQGVNSFEWRIQMWKSSLSKIAQRPIQGYGLTSFKPMSEEFSNARKGAGAHNSYLETLFETGLIGLVSFVLLLLSTFKVFFDNMLKSVQMQQAKLWAILVAYMISYMMICFADNLSYYLVLNWYVWFFIALMQLSERYQHD